MLISQTAKRLPVDSLSGLIPLTFVGELECQELDQMEFDDCLDNDEDIALLSVSTAPVRLR